MLSNIGMPAGISLQVRIRLSGIVSKRRSSTTSAWSLRSQGIKYDDSVTVTRSGRTLMNIPTIDSTPAAREAGRTR